MQISFTPEFAERVKKDLGIKEGYVHNPLGGGNTQQLERTIDEDILLTSVGWANSDYQDVKDYKDDGAWVGNYRLTKPNLGQAAIPKSILIR